MDGSIDDAITAMDRIIDRAIDTGDARGWFAVVYRAVTARVRDGIAAGEFDDNERMELFDVRFVHYWLDAHKAWDRGERVPHSWALSFEAAQRPGLILQHLLLGMNAHINLDLGVAAAMTCPGAAIDDLDQDFKRINAVLSELIDQMQQAIADVSPMTRALDTMGLRFDEALVTFSLGYARQRSWDFARDLAAKGGHADVVEARDRTVAAYGRRIAVPGRPLRWGLPIARWRERPDLLTVSMALRERGADLAL